MSAILEHLVAHSLWANLGLIDEVGRLDAAARGVRSSGAYGSAEETLRHIADAEEFLVAMAEGSPRPTRAPTGTPVDLASVAARTRASHEKVRALLAVDPERPAESRLGPTTVGLLVAQLIHHGNEHRGQVTSLLGANGLAVPDLSVWRYAKETGAV